MTTTFEIRLAGTLDGTRTHDEAVAALAKLFKVDAAKAAQLLAGSPRVVKRGLDAATAEKYVAAIRAAGAVAEAVAEGVAAVEIVAAPAAMATPAATVDAPVPADAPTADHAATKPLALEQPGLRFSLDGRPDFAMATVQVPAGQTIKVEAAAMAAMDTHMVMKTKLGGGFRRLLAGENIFLNEFTAEGGDGEICISPASPGDIGHVFLDAGDVIFLQNSAFLASSTDVVVETKWQGLVKGFFSGESLFLIRASGTGDLWFNTYGAMIELDVDGHYVVDTGNIVAFTDGLEYEVTKVGGYKSLFFSGEGFVCRFRGKGKVWIQTRSVSAFAWWASMFRPVQG